jgi:hypothetical protein
MNYKRMVARARCEVNAFVDAYWVVGAIPICIALVWGMLVMALV